MLKLKVLALLSPLLLAACASTPVAPPNDPVTLRVNVFRGASNIPIYMAVEKGYFARRGITPQLQFTPNSSEQRAGLAAGRFEIAHAAVDNAVAMIEVAKVNAVIVAGGDGGMNELLVRPEIQKVADLRGRTYVVDAPNTAYALIGRKILKDAGLKEGQDFQLNPLGGSEARTKSLVTPAGAATILNPPWNFLAKDTGAKSLGRTKDLYGAYQAQGVFVMRPWAAANASALERYLAAYIEGCRAAQDPAQRATVIQVLIRELKLDARTADMTYTELMTPGHGLNKDCAFDTAGFRNVLALRAEMEGQWGGQAPAADKFVDLSIYQRARGHARP
jgi:ABC-type nitrate/sulfonate/bicarbonate transport system substrate-binding protein